LGEGFGEEGGGVAEDLGSGDHGVLEVVVVVVWSVKLCFWFCVWHRIGGKWLLGNGNTSFTTGAKILGRPCEVSWCDSKGVFEPAVRCFPTHKTW
jgi:hypothetical protein